jgi:response regulator of citrate/malate metabolism
VKRGRKTKKPTSTRVDLVAYLEKAHQPFTITDMIEATGVSRFTASRAVKQALEKDQLKMVGKKATGGVPAPLYQRVA